MAKEVSKTNEEVTDVLIGGKIYTLSGAEPEHMHKVAAFLNKKIAQLKKIPGFSRLDPSYRELLLDINLADEYFKLQAEADAVKKELLGREDELYTARHDLVSQKLKLENALKQEDILEQRVNEWKQKYDELEKLLDELTKN